MTDGQVIGAFTGWELPAGVFTGFVNVGGGSDDGRVGVPDPGAVFIGVGQVRSTCRSLRWPEPTGQAEQSPGLL